MKKVYLILFIVVALFMSASSVDSNGLEWGQVINSPNRFQVLSDFGGDAVLDRETGLIWQRSPSTSPGNWLAAQAHCNANPIGNRYGWRLPTIQELASLLDPTNIDHVHPALPPRHPFIGVQTELLYFSATTRANAETEAWAVSFLDGDTDVIGKNDIDLAWCVRMGQGVDLQ